MAGGRSNWESSLAQRRTPSFAPAERSSTAACGHSNFGLALAGGDASIIGLTNLRVGVLLPHCITQPATCLLQSSLPGAYRLRTVIIHTILVVIEQAPGKLHHHQHSYGVAGPNTDYLADSNFT